MSDKIISNTKAKGKKAVYVWFGGIIFSLLFTILIWITGPYLNHFIITFLPFQGGFWYYWKLPTRNFWTMASMGILFVKSASDMGSYLLGPEESNQRKGQSYI